MHLLLPGGEHKHLLRNFRMGLHHHQTHTMVRQSLTELSRTVKAPGTNQQPRQVGKNPHFGPKTAPGSSFDKKLRMGGGERNAIGFGLCHLSFYVCSGMSFLFSFSLKETCILVIKLQVSQQYPPCQ